MIPETKVLRELGHLCEHYDTPRYRLLSWPAAQSLVTRGWAVWSADGSALQPTPMGLEAHRRYVVGMAS